MKRLSPIFFVLAMLLSSKSYAATFNVTTSSGGGGVPNCAADTNDPKINCNLQEALTVSQANGGDDTINLAAGSGGNYTTPAGSPFLFDSGENFSLTITGAGIGATILDGGGTNEVMSLLNNTAGNIQVSGVTFQNGVVTSLFAGGLALRTIGGNGTVDSCEIKDNSHPDVGGLFLFTLSPGSVSLLNSRVTGNTASASSSIGGGLVASGPGSGAGTVNVENNIFSNNSGDETGGGVIGALGNVTVSNNTFDTNTGTNGQGGAFISSSEGNLIANNNTFIKNTGDQEGGLLLLKLGAGLDKTIQLTNSTFDNNTSNNGTGGANVGSNGSLLIDNNTFFQNTGEIGGGAFTSVMSDVTFTHNTLEDNTATGTTSGATIAAGGGPITAENNTIFSNQGLQGASAFFSSAEISFINNIIAGNSSTDTSTVDGGGATLYSVSSMDIINNTIVDNTLNNNSGFGGGLMITIASDAADTNIYNNIIFGNSVLTAGNGQDLFIDNSPGLNASINFFNNDYNEICFTNGGTQTCDLADVANLSQGANLTAPGLDPLFLDPAAGNFKLGVGSPAIDTGDSSAPNLPATDHDGNPRIVGGEVDMGALEAQPDIGVTPTDLDFDSLGIGQSDTQIVTISNDGSVPMVVNGMVLSDDVNYSLDPNAGSNPCGSLSFTLDVEESCTVGVVFTPTTNGTFDATLTLSSDDPDEPEFVVTITGQGLDFSGGGCSCSLESAASPMNYLALGLIPMILGILRFRLRH